MRNRVLALALLAGPALAGPVLADPALAEVPMSADAFDAYVTGRTLTYAQGGTVYGIEEYLPGRRVRWAFAEGECETGRWYVAEEWICFSYETTPEPQCWQFFRTEAGLMARFRGDAPGSELSEIDRSDAPLNCPGPDVGV